MFRRMKKPLAALALSATVALSAATLPAAPARADNGDVVAGIAALLLLGAVVHHMNDRNNDRRVTRNVPLPPVTHAPARNLRVAPAACFRQIGSLRGYLARCMQQRVARPGLLPPDCIVRVNTHNGPRNLYVGRCLARNGWVREAGFHP